MADIILNDIVKIYEAPPQKRRGLRKAKVQVQPKRAVDGGYQHHQLGAG